MFYINAYRSETESTLTLFSCKYSSLFRIITLVSNVNLTWVLTKIVTKFYMKEKYIKQLKLTIGKIALSIANHWYQ